MGSGFIQHPPANEHRSKAQHKGACEGAQTMKKTDQIFLPGQSLRKQITEAGPAEGCGSEGFTSCRDPFRHGRHVRGPGPRSSPANCSSRQGRRHTTATCPASLPRTGPYRKGQPWNRQRRAGRWTLCLHRRARARRTRFLRCQQGHRGDPTWAQGPSRASSRNRYHWRAP